MSLGIKSSAFLRVEETGASKFEVHTCLQLVGTLGEKLFQDLVPDAVTCHPLEKYALKKPFQASWVQKSYLILSSTSMNCGACGIPTVNESAITAWWQRCPSVQIRMDPHFKDLDLEKL